MTARPLNWLAMSLLVAGAIAIIGTHQRRAAPNAGVQNAAFQEMVDPDMATDPMRSQSQAAGAAIPAIDPFVVSDLQFVIQNTKALIDHGRRRCAELGEPGYEPGYEDADGRAQIDAWRSFQREWDDALNEIASDLPQAPGWDENPDAVAAYQDIARALQELRFVPVGTGDWATPFASMWTGRFDAADTLLDGAADRLPIDPVR
jgi:hypothetical protein